MLAKLTLQLKNMTSKKVSLSMSSLFHGALMELVGEESAAWLHHRHVNPYSQYIQYKDDCIWWTIQTMSTEAYEKIILPLLQEEIQEIEISYHEMKFQIQDKQLSQITQNDFLRKQYFCNYDHLFTIRFLTPTAFKSNGKYQNYPTIRWIIQSLMNKHDSLESENEIFDFEVLEKLEEDCSIIKYNLRSTMFSLEGIRVPSFMGSITILVKSGQSVVNLINYLLMLGKYSGVGIKSSIGMGAIDVEHKERR